VAVINWLNAHGDKDPAAILTALNQYFYDHLRGQSGQNLYCTMWCGLFHLPSYQLTYATAGHPPAVLLYREGDTSHLERLTTASVPIGIKDTSSYNNTTCTIRQGSHLCIFSDGIYEFTQQNKLPLGLDAFLAMILATYSDQVSPLIPSPYLSAAIIPQVTQLMANAHNLEDDISLIELWFEPSSP
jgi:sigma-B regulation protein RsbU (phosphoserine phosphatase)